MNCKSLRGKSKSKRGEIKAKYESVRGKRKSKERYYKKSKSELREFGNQL